jgi:hypothetical protein
MHSLAMAVEFWNGLAAVSSVVAALATLVTVRYARDTVADAREERREAAERHAAALAEQQRTAAATEAAEEETRHAAAEARDAYEQQRAEAAMTLAMQRTLRRIDQIDRIAQLLGALANLARDEAVTPPPNVGMPPIALTRIPTILAELRTAVALHAALGGTELSLSQERADNAYGAGTEAMSFLSRAQAALDHVSRLVATDARYGPVKQPESVGG